MMPPRRGKRSPSIIDCLLRKRRVPKLTQRHLAQRHHDAAPPFLRQHLPNRRRRTFAHRGIQANAPGRAALGIQLSVIRRISSIYQRYCQWYIETFRHNGKTKQRIVRNLGRKEMVEARGDLDRLARSAARLSRRSMILSLTRGGGVPDVRCRRIGAPLLFERLWRDSGCGAVGEELLVGARL